MLSTIQIELYSLFIKSILIAVLVSPFVIKLAFNLGIVDRPDHKRKKHSKTTPYLGGLILYVSWLITGLVNGIDLSDMNWLLTTLGLNLLLVIGIIDDAVDLNSKIKLLVQLFCISLFLCPKLIFNNYEFSSMSTWLFISIFFVSGILIINSFNLIDGLDGLSLGMGILWASCLTYFAVLQGNTQLVLLLTVFIGASLGLSKVNFHPAKIFLGDGGSLFIGGFIFWVLSELFQYQGDLFNWSTSFLVVIISLPTIDVLAVMLYRKANGLGIMSADRNHIHHIVQNSLNDHNKTVSTLHTITFINLMSWIIIDSLNLEHHYMLLWIPIYGFIYLYFRNGISLALKSKETPNEMRTK